MPSSTRSGAGSRATIASSTPVALTIAGSDSSGGAGIQADLRTFHAHAVYGMSALTAVTAQNTRGVVGMEALSADFVGAQIDAAVRATPEARNGVHPLGDPELSPGAEKEIRRSVVEKALEALKEGA